MPIFWRRSYGCVRRAFSVAVGGFPDHRRGCLRSPFLVSMGLGIRRAIRQAWNCGALLLVGDVDKLFRVDLDGAGTVAGISFLLAGGSLMLLLGFFSPLPPLRAKELRGDGKSHVARRPCTRRKVSDSSRFQFCSAYDRLDFFFLMYRSTWMAP